MNEGAADYFVVVIRGDVATPLAGPIDNKAMAFLLADDIAVDGGTAFVLEGADGPAIHRAGGVSAFTASSGATYVITRDEHAGYHVSGAVHDPEYGSFELIDGEVHALSHRAPPTPDLADLWLNETSLRSVAAEIAASLAPSEKTFS